VWPALVAAGGSFALFQFTFATIHLYLPGIVLWPMTDIGGGIFSLVVTAIFLRFWRPREEWHFHTQPASADVRKTSEVSATSEVLAPEKPLSAGGITLAWTPFALMSVLLLLTGLVRQEESRRVVSIGPLQTVYRIPIPWLHNESYRDSRLSLGNPDEAKPERAQFDFAWLTAPGTAVFLAAILSMAMLRMKGVQIRRVLYRTCMQMKIPIPTIAFMLGLSYVTRYSGMDATLGYAFAFTGVLYPFFAAILGWLGVFLTGTDAGSNALFGSLQQITARTIYDPDIFPGLAPRQLEVLVCTANSTGGVMGKMIDAQSICVATAATHQIGREADLFKAVVWHSIVLAAIVGFMTLLQAFVHPFTAMVPMPP
jgi:lactate permease